nr:K823 [uncultured bacterium]
MAMLQILQIQSQPYVTSLLQDDTSIYFTSSEFLKINNRYSHNE